MERNNIRHMFPGGNTSMGFFSYYDYILPQDKAEKIYVLKGGPGVGKSTFMKKIGASALSEGYNVEYMHCSSDPESLDGIVIRDLNIAFIDGTAPHVVDPKNPGAVDEIIHLGDYWKEDEVKKNREFIMRDNKLVGEYFKRAYKYLKAAATVCEANNDIYEKAFDKHKVNIVAKELSENIFDKDEIAERAGRQRHLFASAITPKGLLNYLPSVLNTKKLIVLKGQYGTDAILHQIKDAANLRGYCVECFYCALFPKKLEHIVIPGKDVSICTSNKYHTVLTDDHVNYNMEDYMNKEILKAAKDEMEYNRMEFEGLINRGVMTIQTAKSIHDKMERYYIPNMDFNSVDKLIKKITKKILK